ncbi:sigma 54-interacting transcriptional regulator [Bacillus sp. CLL-7-23]|uniref:Sigma 54-interacting transcriptional regulator n=1 Tax=Bacillus changyiensis TaxID=3004103 RepID=A0ABT4X536_9BACI|nr:sigma-54-dependent transcriptional regulator [Bacillus changyiensis]MDA7026482.1 sigma 54-interacting transcriptional regulator [Bacillus changyiensis]
MLKKDLLSYLDEKTCHFDWDKSSVTLTAVEISKIFHVKRNTVSHYLNQLVHEGLVIKINTRPVYFLSRKIFEKKNFQLSTCIFDSFQELKESDPISVIGLDLFDQLIGADGSLKRAIEQIKTSVCYPDGLPIILHGPTGVGKSYLANLIYQYSLEKGILPKNAPFIRFNCAQYANNPELLSSNLFGYVKGAFTGADATKRGLLDAADGGILFLDEVHRLNEEGQEKLFTFLDQGIFRRMGESEGEHQANVRLIFATTEELERSFLRTFLRRIPIKVWIPGLDERGEKEKKQFVYLFLINEAQKLRLPLRISTRALDALTKHHYDGNMGELKNLIKYIAASAFVKKEVQKEVSITLLDLPESILENTIRYTDNKYKQNHEIIISPNTTLDQLFKSSTSYLSLIKTTYSHILKFYEEHQSTNFDRSIFEKYIFNETNLLFDNLIFHASKKRVGVMIELTTVNVQEIVHHLENMFNVRFNGNSVYAMAYFLYYKGNAELQLLKKQKTLIENLSKFVDLNYKTEQQLAKQLVHFIESKLDVKLFKMDKIFLTFYLRSIAMEQTNNKVQAIILAHGYATASSIANVANRLLRKNVFEAFDMPIDVSVEDIAAQVLNYIEHNDVSKGLVILVDMGSLKDIYSQFKLHINGPVVIINNVSTQMALHLGDMLNKDLYLEDMIERLQAANQTEYSMIYPETNKEKVIVTSCMTGMGTAIQIQKLLTASIPEDLGIKVIAHDYNRLKEHGTSEAIFQMYLVLAVIGTADPELDQVAYISLEDLISGQGEEKFRKMFQPYYSTEQIQGINDNLIRNCSLERVIESLTILDTNKILAHVEKFLNRLELLLNKRLANAKKIALYVHVSCLIERLIRQAPIENYTNAETFEQCQKDMINNIKEAFSVIESIYNVKINLAEIGYIYDYLIAKSSDDSEF